MPNRGLSVSFADGGLSTGNLERFHDAASPKGTAPAGPPMVTVRRKREAFSRLASFLSPRDRGACGRPTVRAG